MAVLLGLMVSGVGVASTASHGNAGGQRDHGKGGGRHHGNGGQPTAFLRQVAAITFPAPYLNPTSFDISFADPVTEGVYVADHTNAAVDAIDGSTDSFGSLIGAGLFSTGATGSNPVSPAQAALCGTGGGPNGVLSLSVGGVNQVWAGDAESAANPVSNVKVFTLSTPTSGTLAATIPMAVAANGTSGKCRADEMAYDPQDQLVLVANDKAADQYVSLISVNANAAADSVVAQIKLPEAVGGIEQPVYDPETGLFYINVPGVEVAVIDPDSRTLTTTFPTPNCSATGLALDEATQNMLLSCGTNPNGVEFMNPATGEITANFPQVSGADEVWFDPNTRNFYLAASGMTSTEQRVGSVTTSGSATAWTLSQTAATGGTFTLTVGGTTTAALPYNAAAADVQAALAAIVPGTTVSGGPLPTKLSITFGAPETTFTANVADLDPSGYATPVLGVIGSGDGSGLQWVTNVPTLAGAHSVTADPVNGQVFVPISGLGIVVYAWTKP